MTALGIILGAVLGTLVAHATGQENSILGVSFVFGGAVIGAVVMGAVLWRRP